MNLARAKSGSPTVLERMIEAPLGVTGWFRRQKGPSRFWLVSVLPLSPLLSRHTREDTPSEPAISTTSLWVSVVWWPISAMMAQAS